MSILLTWVHCLASASPHRSVVRTPTRLSYLHMNSIPDGSRTPHDAGNSDFSCLYEQHFPAVWAYAVSRVGRQAAEDVVSEAFAVAWRRQTSVPPDALPWLLRVARNVIFELYRSETRQRLLETELRGWAAHERLVEPDIAESVVNRANALTAVASLSERDRELLMLVAWHGLSPRQAASVLGCSRPAFFVRLHRARSRLARALTRQVSTSVPSDLIHAHRGEEVHT
jgi:RNA polymerase sigma-70 factor (ECF subfamily)